MKIVKKFFPGFFIGIFATIVFTIAVHTIPLLGFAKIDLSSEITRRVFGSTKRFYIIGHSIHYLTGASWAIVYHLFGRAWIAKKIKISQLPVGMSYGTIWSLLVFITTLLFLIIIGRYETIFTTGILTLLSAHLLYGIIIGTFLEFE